EQSLKFNIDYKQEALNAYTDYIARVSLGIIKNPSSGEYNYESKVLDIVYHGGTVQDNFKKESIGKSTIDSNKNDFGQPKAFYFTTSEESSKTYGNVKQVILNVKNPEILEQSLEDIGFGLKRKNKFTDVQKLNLENKDGFILKDIFDAKSLETLSTKDLINDKDGRKQLELNKKIESQYGDTIGVFEPEQIHILSSKADIQGFKEFVDSNQSNIQYQKQIDLNSIYLNTNSSRNITISPQRKKLIDKFLDQIGVDSISVTKELMEMNLGKDVRGIADLTAGLIGIVEGLEYTDTFEEE